jgi:hypothetical protein
VWIFLDADRTRHATDQDEAGQRQDSESGALIYEMRGRIKDLQEQLQAERQALLQRSAGPPVCYVRVRTSTCVGFG